MATEKQALKHLGKLFKISNGKEYKPDAQGVKGTFYVRFQENGKMHKVRLLDDDGKPITNLKDAKAAQWKLRAAYITDDKISAIRASMGEVAHLEEQRKQQEEQANPPLRIDEAWERWLEIAAPECGAGSIRNYGGYWRAFVEFCRKSGRLADKGLYLRDVSPELARARVSQLETAGTSANTINKNIMFLRSFFETLKEPARMAANPFDGIKARKGHGNPRRVLTLEELQKVINGATGELHTLFVLGISTGMRLEDCCLLKWDEIDMAAGVIRHRPFKTLHSSGASVVIGISGELREELSQIRAAIADGEPGAGYVLKDYAASYLAGNNGKGRTRVCCRIQRHFQKCGIQTTRTIDADGKEIENPKEYKGTKHTITLVGFHSLRHTWITLQAMAGTPQAVVQASAGHSNPVMTEHYTHVSEKAALSAAGVIDATFREIAGDAASDGEEALRRAVLDAIGKASREQLERVLEVLEG